MKHMASHVLHFSVYTLLTQPAQKSATTAHIFKQKLNANIKGIRHKVMR